MEACLLPYIPERLKTNHKEVINNFFVDELLYMRCKPDDIINPYKSITITELSHNRSGNPQEPLCEKDDALYSVKEDEEIEIYADKVVCKIQIIDLSNDLQYDKLFIDNGNKARLKLIHEPIPCMYPHSVFRVWYNDTIVTYDNYKDNIKKSHKLRNSLKTELASMVITEKLSQSGEEDSEDIG